MCSDESRSVCVRVCCQQTVLTVARFHHVCHSAAAVYQHITQFVSKLYRMCHIRSIMFQFKIDQN